MKTFFISLNAKDIGTIDRYPHDASDEKGLTLCVINNSRGTLTDKACEKAIAEKMGKRRVSDVLLIRSDGTCWRKRKYKEPRRDHTGPIKAPFNASLLNQSYTETGI